MTQAATSRVDGGYTVIELLVVVAIVLALAALVLTLINGKPAEVKKTHVIIEAVRSALALAGAQRGSAISPTEHPFAGSQAEAGGQRFAFMRSDPAWPGAVSTSGTALKGVPHPGYLDADAGHLLMPSDRYADRRIALLYGVRRADIGVLQSQRKVVTKYRQLPMPTNPSDGSQAKVVSPRTGKPTPGGYQGDVHLDYPDTLVPSTAQRDDPSYGRLADTKPALDYLFGASNAQSELAALKAIYNADPTLPAEVNDFRIPVEARTVGAMSEGLVYTNHGTDSANQTAQMKAEPQWKPGRIPVSGGAVKNLDQASGTWVRYRLAGLAIYDAWGNELMTVAGGNDTYRVISAGLDGVLAVAPGTDSTLDTALVGDLQGSLPIDPRDLDGAKDNLQ